MAQINGYKEELQDELQKTNPDSHASRLLAQELERLEKGEDRKDSRSATAVIDIHPDQPQTVALKVRIPAEDFPKFNFVGKLLGPKGNTLKRLQEETGCKMAILGKGSMRDKTKEEELRKEGGKKYAHLNDELHVYVEAQAEMTDGYRRVAHALGELKKFLIPSPGLDEGQALGGRAVPPLVMAFQALLSQQRAAGPGCSGPVQHSVPQRCPQRMPGFCPRMPAFPPVGPMSCGRGLVPLLRGCIFPPTAGLFPPVFPFQQPPAKIKQRKARPKPKRKPTPWYASIREEFHLLKRLKRRAERKWQKSKKAEDREAFNVAKRKLNYLVSKAKAALDPPRVRRDCPEESRQEADTSEAGGAVVKETGVGPDGNLSDADSYFGSDDSSGEDSEEETGETEGYRVNSEKVQGTEIETTTNVQGSVKTEGLEPMNISEHAKEEAGESATERDVYEGVAEQEAHEEASDAICEEVSESSGLSEGALQSLASTKHKRF